MLKLFHLTKMTSLKINMIIVGMDNRDTLIEDLHKMIDAKDEIIETLKRKLSSCVCQPISSGYRGGDLEDLSERQLRRVTKPLVKVIDNQRTLVDLVISKITAISSL